MCDVALICSLDSVAAMSLKSYVVMMMTAMSLKNYLIIQHSVRVLWLCSVVRLVTSNFLPAASVGKGLDRSFNTFCTANETFSF